jgi:hypothetical protein
MGGGVEGVEVEGGRWTKGEVSGGGGGVGMWGGEKTKRETRENNCKRKEVEGASEVRGL